MKIALICPSNLLYMPYVSNYINILKFKEVDFDIINWDRFHIEEGENSLIYRDGKSGHKRNYLDYYKFKRFIIRKLNSINYDKIIVFGIQLTYFLKGILLKFYKDKFIIDIRDHNKIINFFNLKKLVDHSFLTVISSPGYKKWLPDSDKYVVNHNTTISRLEELKKNSYTNSPSKITIAYIGALRDYSLNINFINSLKNTKKVKLLFHGEGDINNSLIEYIRKDDIDNVFLTGRYNKEKEESLYKNSDLINILIPNSDINSKTLLPNRLYNAAFHAKPIVAYQGSYTSNEIGKYNLGLVLNSFYQVESQIENYLKNFNIKKYEQGREAFFKAVIGDNKIFRIQIENFLNSEMEENI